MPEFKPQLPRPIKWSVGENRYDSNGKQPRSINVFIPLESINSLHDYIDVVAAHPTRVKSGKVWDYEQQSEVQVDGIYLNGKGRTGNGGDYGTINPPAVASSDEETPF